MVLADGPERDWFCQRRHHASGNCLADAGVNMQWKGEPKGDKLTGKTLVVTGTLETLSRSEAEALIKDNGGKAGRFCFQKQRGVVAGAAAGSADQSIAALGVPSFTEAESCYASQRISPSNNQKTCLKKPVQFDDAAFLVPCGF